MITLEQMQERLDSIVPRKFRADEASDIENDVCLITASDDPNDYTVHAQATYDALDGVHGVSAVLAVLTANAV